MWQGTRKVIVKNDYIEEEAMWRWKMQTLRGWHNVSLIRRWGKVKKVIAKDDPTHREGGKEQKVIAKDDTTHREGGKVKKKGYC